MSSYEFYVPVLRKAFCFSCTLSTHLLYQREISLLYLLQNAVLGLKEIACFN